MIRTAIAFFKTMDTWKLQPDVLSYSTAMSCGDWQLALNLFHKMPGDRIAADVVSLSSAITSLQKFSSWRRASFELFRRGIETFDVVMYGLAIRCCELAMSFPHLSSCLLQSMQDRAVWQMFSAKIVSSKLFGHRHRHSNSILSKITGPCRKTPQVHGRKNHQHPTHCVLLTNERQAVSVKGRVGLALDFDLTKTPAWGLIRWKFFWMKKRQNIQSQQELCVIYQ